MKQPKWLLPIIVIGIFLLGVVVAKNLGYNSSFTIYDNQDQLSLIKNIMKKLIIFTGSEKKKSEMLSII